MTMASQSESMFNKDGLRAVLHHISKNLDPHDERNLKFLLRDALHKNELGKSLQDVFQHLEEKKKITKENIPWIIIDGLQCIGQIRLITTCFGKTCMREHRKEPRHVEPFRRLLFDTGMSLTTKEWQMLVYLFGDDIPKSRRETFQSALDLFTFLEEKCLIGTEDTETLQGHLKLMERIDLANKLQDFHNGAVPSDSSIPTTDLGANPPINETTEYGSIDKHPALTSKFTVILKDSVIKGIHVNKLNPPVEKQLFVIHEEGNKHDQNSCIVSVPHSRFRKCRQEGKKRRIIEDITDRTVGYVPKVLSKTMRFALDTDCNVMATKTGKPCPSFPPWPPMFCRGGGLVLPCDYIFNCYDEARKTAVVVKLNEVLSTMEENGNMSLITEL